LNFIFKAGAVKIVTYVLDSNRLKTPKSKTNEIKKLLITKKTYGSEA
jgi:hypothetical protein